MDRYKFLTPLLEYTADNDPFISLYVDTRVNENGKKTFDVFLKKQLTDNLDRLARGQGAQTSFESDAEKIRRHFDDLDPSVEGVALFACSAKGIFMPFEFQVPFEENMFFVFDRPHLYPLIRLISMNRKFAVAQTDTNSAHIYVFRRGEVVSREDIQNVKTNRTEVGGWSQMRFQRHVENFHQQHAKEVAAELEKIVRDDKVEHVILAGDETVIIPMLRAELSKELEEKVVGTLPLNVIAPEHEVLAESLSVLRRHQTLADMEKVKLLNEQNFDGGRGIANLDNVLTALLNGQVQELYVNSDFSSINYDADRVREIFKDYLPNIDERWPEAEQGGLVIDELLKLAARTADDIRFIDDESLLKPVGGVGAMLRYQARGVNV